MPIYEYNCPHCGVFEEIQRITAPALKKCPKCGAKINRMVSRTSFVLKGSGWYVTDYARKGSKSDDSSSGDSANGTTSKPDTSASSDKGTDKSTEKTASKTADKSSSSKSEKPAAAKSD